MTNELFLAIEPKEWVVDQVIATDWYDGPRAGLCRMRLPAVEFAFELLQERYAPDDLGDRLFTIGLLASGTVEALLTLLDFAGGPTDPVWVPLWRSTDPSDLEIAARAIETARKDAVHVPVIIRTRDFEAFTGRWAAPESTDILDWFEYFGIADE